MITIIELLWFRLTDKVVLVQKELIPRSHLSDVRLIGHLLVDLGVLDDQLDARVALVLVPVELGLA